MAALADTWLLLQKAKGNKKQSVGSRLVTVEVIEAWDLQPWDDNGKADPYVKLNIGNQKRKSKVRRMHACMGTLHLHGVQALLTGLGLFLQVCTKTLHPVWRQRFEFPLHDQVSQLLKLELYDRDLGGSDERMGG